MLGSRLSLNRLAECIERRSWLVQLWLWALSCMRHRPTKYPKKRLLGKVIVSVDVAVGSIASLSLYVAHVGFGGNTGSTARRCGHSGRRDQTGALKLRCARSGRRVEV